MKQLLLLAAMGVSIFAQQPAEPKPIIITGKVTHAGSGAALKKAKVSLLPVSGDPPATAETDGEGRYKLETPKPGRFRIRAEKSGYESGMWGAPKPN